MKTDELEQKDPLHAPVREIDHRPRREQRQRDRPQNGDMHITRRRMRQHADDLAGGFLLRRADRRRDRLVIVFAELHHQLQITNYLMHRRRPTTRRRRKNPRATARRIAAAPRTA